MTTNYSQQAWKMLPSDKRSKEMWSKYVRAASYSPDPFSYVRKQRRDKAAVLLFVLPFSRCTVPALILNPTAQCFRSG